MRQGYRALFVGELEGRIVAVRRGTPMLVIQAGHMSRPILERLGFETTAVIHVLVDDLRAHRRA